MPSPINSTFQPRSLSDLAAAVPTPSLDFGTTRATPSAATYPLVIGPLTLGDCEHPTSFPIPLKQQVAVHQQAGGTRNIQLFGAQPGQLVVKGTFYDYTAVAKMKLLRSMLTSGKAIMMSWGPMKWQVVVVGAEPDVHHKNEIGYTLTCEVVQDFTGTGGSVSNPSIDTQNQSLWDQAQTRYNNLQSIDPTTASWSPQMTATGTLLQQASPISSASSSALQSAIQQVNTTLGTVTKYVSPLLGSATQSSLQKLFVAQGILSNLQLISTNLNSGNPAKTVTVLGGDLVALAVTHYGDPKLWTIIAAANGLWSMSPIVNTKTPLKIPPKPAQSSAVPQVVNT